MRGLSVLLAILLLGCTAACRRQDGAASVSSKSGTDELAEIAAVGSIDLITHVHVRSLLRQHKITCFLGGSIVYGVTVNKADAKRATAILKADAAKRGYWIQIDGKPVKPLSGQMRAKPLVQKLNSPLNSLLTTEEFAPSTEMGSVLRDEHISELTAQYPFVGEIRRTPRLYLGPDGAEHTGYEVEVQMRSSLEDGSKTAEYGFQVLEGGSEAFFQGGRRDG